MARHLSDAAVIDALEGRTSAHVENCRECGLRLEAASAGLTLAREAGVPEPSPLYWEAFRRQVGRRIEGMAAWSWRWRPALLAAALVIALAGVLPQSDIVPTRESRVLLPAWSALPPSEEDPGLVVLRSMRPSADDLRAAAPCDMTECIVSLSDDDSLALFTALQEMKGRDL